MSKKKIPVRFPNESTYVNIEINPKMLKEITVWDEDVFATIDDIRIAMTREDYNKLFENEE
jgi:ribosomal protein L20